MPVSRSASPTTTIGCRRVAARSQPTGRAEVAAYWASRVVLPAPAGATTRAGDRGRASSEVISLALGRLDDWPGANLVGIAHLLGGRRPLNRPVTSNTTDGNPR
ncbi:MULTISPECIES: hypothetical protein [unclassified Micromonospora]|uniref:hypothetical protein n=1 Tax=unclassified Micromonospora TaxID=2617518 RepID=UPI00362C5024